MENTLRIGGWRGNYVYQFIYTLYYSIVNSSIVGHICICKNKK